MVPQEWRSLDPLDISQNQVGSLYYSSTPIVGLDSDMSTWRALLKGLLNGHYALRVVV